MENRKEGSDLGVAPETVAGLSGSTLRSGPADDGVTSPTIPNATQHTPGPWYITDGPQYGYNKLKRVDSASGKFGTVICERFSADGVEGLKEEVEANLTLIAAAPDLLAALVRLASAPPPSSPADCLTEQGYLEDRSEYDSSLTVARAAIAKATTPNT